MKAETIEKILNFLKEKEGKEIPLNWNLIELIEKLKLIEELENHPDGIQYKHYYNLNLSNSNITKLPKDVYIDASLYLDNCQQLTELPDKLHVEGSLILPGCKELTELPNNLYVGGYLDLGSCKQLIKLPDNLYVGDDLFLDYCKQITELPNNLHVDGALHIDNTPLAQKYSSDEIREMITSKGGTVIGKIYR